MYTYVDIVYSVRTGSKLIRMLRCQSSTYSNTILQLCKTIQWRCYAPINGMPHLAYLRQMLEKGGRFAVKIFLEELVHALIS